VQMRPMLLLASLIALSASAVMAQSGSFQVAFHGKPVGTAEFRTVPAGEGRSSNATVHVETKGVSYAISKTARLTAAGHLRQADLSAVVNGQAVHVTATAEAMQIRIAIAANGRTTTTALAAHKLAVFLPDFDPSALETLLQLAAAHNSRDLWVILPKQNGVMEAVQMATYPDEKGTLDGKPAAVHHLIASYAGMQSDLFSGPDNQLLQAELPQQGFALVRKGFVLTPPAKPLAAPAEDGGK